MLFVCLVVARAVELAHVKEGAVEVAEVGVVVRIPGVVHLYAAACCRGGGHVGVIYHIHGAFGNHPEPASVGGDAAGVPRIVAAVGKLQRNVTDFLAVVQVIYARRPAFVHVAAHEHRVAVVGYALRHQPFVQSGYCGLFGKTPVKVGVLVAPIPYKQEHTQRGYHAADRNQCRCQPRVLLSACSGGLFRRIFLLIFQSILLRKFL